MAKSETKKRHSARRLAPSLSPLQGFARELLFPPLRAYENRLVAKWKIQEL
jgi:hypothetical protein